VKRKIGDYDRNAIECAVSLCEAHEGTSIVLTAGTDEARTSLKDALSRGADSAVFIHDEVLESADSTATARVIAKALGSIDPVDLVVCGEGSSDEYAQQVGPRLAQLLGIPVITSVNKIDLSADVVRCERKLEDGIEVVEVPLPAVVAVLPDLGDPRIPGLKQILGASKKPVQEFSAADLGLSAQDLAPKMQRVAVVGATSTRRNVTLTGTAAEVVASLVEVLKQEELV
jgi:electron transfer flavoprotein beta subunit